MIRAGVYPDLLDEAYGWGLEDMWEYAFYALVLYARVAAERTGRPPEAIAIAIAERRGVDLRSFLTAGHECHDDVGSTAVEVLAPAVIDGGRPRIGVTSGDLDVTERHPCIERRHDERGPGACGDGRRSRVTWNPEFALALFGTQRSPVQIRAARPSRAWSRSWGPLPRSSLRRGWREGRSAFQGGGPFRNGAVPS